ncbi:class I SAM-dependent methyltransferase [Leptospira stimsonii]|uniref:Class I SAM-dependent methyltransferase n=1 Tax=Leptospira stimsonii TaxID=2202203 RepID=A0A4R9L1A7_9LEPT|nr:class I SAM-dependent methyltransferase [Leptospira stimsonii]RHX86337.1 class I SAM-dependent methyltransferase [Leptospira stimsonii]TGK14538.1 class I SAM-dependent methyltransferase [Leptospira stimsonii]TGM09961.1 class I SAM-dependent methyltransferase [Leptospira stimsonii]
MKSSLDKSEIQREHFNKIKDNYNKARSGSNHLAYKKVWWDRLLSSLSNKIDKAKKLSGLEAMCGLGEGSTFLKGKFPLIQFEGFDYSDEMVIACKKENSAMTRVFHQDILKFNEKEKYDIVILLGGLHHVPDSVDVALAKIYVSLKKGGLFINLEPTHNNFLFKWVRERIYKKNALFEESSERGFELKEYNRLLKQARFQILDQFYPGLLGYVLYYNPDAFPFLDRGSVRIAKGLSHLDWILGKTFLGIYFSFATWSVCKK